MKNRIDFLYPNKKRAAFRGGPFVSSELQESVLCSMKGRTGVLPDQFSFSLSYASSSVWPVRIGVMEQYPANSASMSF